MPIFTRIDADNNGDDVVVNFAVDLGPIVVEAQSAGIEPPQEARRKRRRHFADVDLFWDPNVLAVVDIGPPWTVEHKGTLGTIRWRRREIPDTGTKQFTAKLRCLGAGSTPIIGTAASSSEPSASSANAVYSCGAGSGTRIESTLATTRIRPGLIRATLTVRDLGGEGDLIGDVGLNWGPGTLRIGKVQTPGTVVKSNEWGVVRWRNRVIPTTGVEFVADFKYLGGGRCTTLVGSASDVHGGTSDVSSVCINCADPRLCTPM